MKKEKRTKQPNEEKVLKAASITRKSKFILLSACSVVVGVGSTLGLFLYSLGLDIKTTVPILVRDVEEGTKILAEDVTTIEIHPNALTKNMVTSAQGLVGAYALKDMSANEYIYKNWISANYYKRLAERAQYTAIPVPVDQFTSVNGEIKENDFVMFSVILGKEEGSYASDVTSNQLPEEKITILEPPQLAAVRVLGVINSDGLSVDELRDAVIQPDGSIPLDSSLEQPTMLIVDVNDVQRTMLLQAMNAGKLQAVILPESVQQRKREEYGLIQHDVKENETEKDTIDAYNEDTSELESHYQAEIESQLQSEADRLGISYEEASSRYEEQLKEATTETTTKKENGGE